MRRKVTLRDIGKATGLSTFTVSKALNGGEGVSAKSREMVRAAARDLGYVANLAAQELRGAGRSSMAVITSGTSNAYYLDMMNGIQRAMQRTGQSVVVMDIAVNGIYDPALEDWTIQRLLEARMSGVISTLTLKPASIERLAQWDIPIVFVDSSPPEAMSHLPSVTTDNYNASLLVGGHLAGHGYRDWVFLVYPGIWSSRHDRERGLLDSARRSGAVLTVLESGNDAAYAEQTFAAYLEGRPDSLPEVLIAGNNPMLLGALSLMRKRGIRAPQDMAIVSYDEFAWAPFVDPPLTVLNERSEEIGRLASEMLLSIIDEQAEAIKRGEDLGARYRPEHQLQVPVDLIVRQSCGCVAGTSVQTNSATMASNRPRTPRAGNSRRSKS